MVGLTKGRKRVLEHLSNGGFVHIHPQPPGALHTRELVAASGCDPKLRVLKVKLKEVALLLKLGLVSKTSMGGKGRVVLTTEGTSYLRFLKNKRP